MNLAHQATAALTHHLAARYQITFTPTQSGVISSPVGANSPDLKVILYTVAWHRACAPIEIMVCSIVPGAPLAVYNLLKVDLAAPDSINRIETLIDQYV